MLGIVIAVIGGSDSRFVRVRRGRAASVRTQLPMFAVFLLAGGPVVGMTGPGAHVGYCAVRGRGKVGMRGGSGGHGEAWWWGGAES